MESHIKSCVKYGVWGKVMTIRTAIKCIVRHAVPGVVRSERV